MTGLCKNIKKYIDDFTKDILTYQITREVFERERNIVIAEYKLYYSDETMRFKLNWLRAHYNNTSVIGLLTDLQNITYQKFIQFKNRITKQVKQCYYFRNKTKQVYNLTTKIDNNDQQIRDLNYKFSDTKQNKYPMEEYSTGQNDQSIIYIWKRLKFKDNKIKQIALSKLLCDYLVGGLTSFLYQQIREKLGCVYCIIPQVTVFKEQGYINFVISTDQQHKQLVIDQINNTVPKLIKQISNKEYNSVYKSKMMNHKININTNYTNYNLLYNPQIVQLNKYWQKKLISYKEFKQFVKQFIQNYKIFNDKEYLKD